MKINFLKRVLVISAISLILTMYIPSYAAPNIIYISIGGGDADYNGKVTSADARLILRVSGGQAYYNNKADLLAAVKKYKPLVHVL